MENFKVIPKWIVYPEIQFEANAKYDRNRTMVEDGYKFSKVLDYDKEDNTISVGLTIKQTDQEELNLKYSYKIQVYAIFEVQEDLLELEDRLLKKVITDISNLLIGSLREFIISLTTRAPWGELILPILETKNLNREFFKSLKEYT